MSEAIFVDIFLFLINVQDHKVNCNMKVKHLIFPIRNSKIYCATFKLNLQSQLFRIVLIAVKIENS